MATLTWLRQRGTANPWQAALSSARLADLNPGQTIVRNHISWGFGGYTWTRLAPTSMQGLIMGFGLATTIGNGTEGPPDPITSTGNELDPSERWLYLTARAPECVVWDVTNNTAIWQSSPAEEDSQSKGQVLAPTSMGVGNFLNLWAAWRPFGPWDVSGQATLWWSVQTLVRTP